MNKIVTHSSLLIIAIALSIWTSLRVALWFNVGLDSVGFSQALYAFVIGFWFDLATLTILISPWLIGSVLIPYKIRASKWATRLAWLGIALMIYALVFGAIAEYIFWQEFTTRFNFIAVDYLIYTHEVIGNIRESYPVPLILLAIGLLTVIFTWLLKRYFTLKVLNYSLKNKYYLFIFFSIIPLLSLAYSNADQMHFSLNSYANELSGNGLFSFAAAARRNELDYDQFYRTIPQREADAILAKLGVKRPPLSNDSSILVNRLTQQRIDPFKRKPKNIILISVESLSAEFLGTYGSRENLTPNLDQIAKESLVFDKVFAAGTRTVRGLDALSVATPPIPGQAIVHRPNNAHLATLGEFLEAQHYSTFFIYGGYGMFDNMNNYFKGNDYQVIDRTDFDKSTIQSENVWGVDDESLFRNAIDTLDRNVKTHKPFFAHIMTTSNHRPFTFPEGKIDLPQGDRDGAIKYTDYALGQFIKLAKTKPWFKDTLFVIVADHCASVAGKTKLPVAKYHIPLFFYAPDLLAPGHYKTMASQIDIVPTLMNILGARGRDSFFGADLFDVDTINKPARAFISNYQALGYYKSNTLVVLSPKRLVETYHVDPVSYESTPIKMDNQLIKEAIAYYQTASRAYKQGDLSEFAQPNQAGH
jgi:phosphoglycerol transferase MdoB-like AlkP superfamily enzyme